MSGKFKLLWVLFLCAWLATASGQSVKQPNHSPRLLIIGDYFSGDVQMGGANQQHTYDVLRIFIVNYCDDTLKYRGTNCHPTELFTLSDNNYFNLVDGDCKNSAFEQEKIPPHRSQLIPLKLSMKKQPYNDIELQVSMKFYHWSESNSFEKAKKHPKPVLLTDKITLRYNKEGNQYYDRTDFAQDEQKTKLNLPTLDLYLLSADDRKLYTLTIDESKITTTITAEHPSKGSVILHVPVNINNNSDKVLKYYSMMCSWVDFYHLDVKNLGLLPDVCDGNIPTLVTVLPHSTHTDIVPVVCDKNDLNKQLLFKIGLNINKITERRLFSSCDEQLRVYNIVWSNEVQFTPK